MTYLNPMQVLHLSSILDELATLDALSKYQWNELSIESSSKLLLKKILYSYREFLDSDEMFYLVSLARDNNFLVEFGQLLQRYQAYYDSTKDAKVATDLNSFMDFLQDGLHPPNRDSLESSTEVVGSLLIPSIATSLVRQIFRTPASSESRHKKQKGPPAAENKESDFQKSKYGYSYSKRCDNMERFGTPIQDFGRRGKESTALGNKGMNNFPYWIHTILSRTAKLIAKRK